MEFLYQLNEIEKPVIYLKEILSENSIKYPVILLSGEMGAGKTTFTSYFVKSYDQSLNPNSPTFNLMNEYKINQFSIFHFDLYRLKFPEEVENLGFEEIWGKQGLSVIEWWEIAKDYFNFPVINIRIEILDENTRKMNIEFTN